MLDAALQALGGSDVWDAALAANEHPTYYGMMAASFERRPQ